MGLDAGYPAVRINDPASTVPVWNGAHTIIGRLGPDDYYHSAAVNVTCVLKRLNGRWYRLLNPNGWDLPATSAYVSTGPTHLMDNSQVTHPLYDCERSNDQPGRRWPWWLIFGTLAATLATLLWRLSKRRAVRSPVPSPVPPRPGPPVDLSVVEPVSRP